MPLSILTVLPFDGAGFNGYGCGCGCGPCACSAERGYGLTTQGLGEAPAPAAPDAAAGGGESGPKPSAEWTGQQWSIFFQGLGQVVKPLMTATGALIDLRSGRTLFPAGSETAQLYAAFMAQQQKQQQPSWMMPAIILGGAAVLALVIARR